MNVAELARQYKKGSGSTLSVRGIQKRISRYRNKIHEMNEFDIDTKVKMIFALADPVDDGFLIELKKTADVVVDDLKRIIQYKKKGGGLELNWKFFPEECCRKMLELLEEKSKTVNTPMTDRSFMKEFKSATGDQSTLDSLRHRYERVKKSIYKSSKFNRNTKVKMMFISNARITKNMLNELRKCARVEVDEQGRIKKYEANDGSLNLKGVHGSSNANKCLNFDRWRSICQKVINTDDSADDEEGSNGDKKVENEYINLIRYVIDRTKDASSPLNIRKLALDYKKEFGRLERWECICKRIRRFRQRIGGMDVFDTPTIVRCLFALNARITADVLKRIEKDAIVELDEERRIKKYEAKDGSLNLGGEHGRTAKKRAETRELKDSSDSEEAEDSSDDEESEKDGDENLSDFGGDYDEDLPSYHQYDDRNHEENESPENENDADISSMVTEPINVFDDRDNRGPSASQQNQEKHQEEDSEKVPIEKEPQGPLEDQNVAENPSDALTTSQLVEQAAESIEQKPENLIENVHANKLKRNCIELMEPKPENLIELPQEIKKETTYVRDIPFLLKAQEKNKESLNESSAHQIHDRISEQESSDLRATKRARISYSSSGESGKKLSDEDESEDLSSIASEPINVVDCGVNYDPSQQGQERIQEENSEPRSKRSRMSTSAAEESREVAKPVTIARDILLLLKDPLIGFLKIIESTVERMDTLIEELDVQDKNRAPETTVRQSTSGSSN